MTDSMNTDPRTLELERGIPTTAEDVRVLRELRATKLEDGPVHVSRLLAPGWTLAAAAARPIFKDYSPFKL